MFVTGGGQVLHVHSHYSLRTGRLSVAALAEQAAAAGRGALALADRDALWGLPELRAECGRRGLQAIPGVTLTVVGALGERDELVLFARGPEGYRSLCRAVTAAHLEAVGAAGPGLPVERLPEFGAGLLAWAGPRSEPGRLLAAGRAAEAARAAAGLAGAFPGAAYGAAAGLPDLSLPALAERCRPAFPDRRPRFPRFPAPGRVTEASYLCHLARQGLADLGLGGRPGYGARLEHELDVICRLGMAGYFLVLWDLVRFARAQNIPVGPGRGSAVGSLAVYCLGITAVDPLAAGLYFERFLNPERADFPDVDLDICSRGRPRLIEYLFRRWGHGAVAHCGLLSTLGPRGAVRAAGRLLGTDPALVDTVARVLPGSYGSLERALAELPELQALGAGREPLRSLFREALALAGRPWNVTVHAAGVVIGPGPLPELVPLMRAGGGEVITQYPADALEELGLIKIDLLGLRNLTVIADVQAQVPGLRLEEMPPTDPGTYAMLAAGEAIGTFQLDSPGMRRLLRQVHPERFDDLVALLAMYRPGPFQAGAVAQYVARRQGRAPVEWPHPALQGALADTYGVLLYQEQVMLAARDAAGLSPGEADSLRRALARGEQAAAAWHERFVAGARTRGLALAEAEAVWHWLTAHAGYTFNKAHTTAYALVAYWTAYLKAHYPAHYFAALLATEIGYFGPGVYAQEARKRGVEVLPADVNRSGLTYQVEGERAIRIGLLQVKGVGPAAAAAVLTERAAGGPFAGPADLAGRLARHGVPRSAAVALAAAGTVPGAAAAEPARQLTLGDFGLPGAAPAGDAPGAPPPAPALGRLAPDLSARLRQWGATPAAAMAGLPAGTDVLCGGVMVGARRRPARGGVGLTILVQDDTGLVEVLVPPAVYRRDLQEIDPDGLAVRGRTLGGGEARVQAGAIRAATTR